jgi:hypothetical protein
MDISSVIPQVTKPKNVDFMQGNILDGLPFQVGMATVTVMTGHDRS